MNCKEFENTLLLQDDKNLGLESKKHIENCETCHDVYKENSTMNSLLTSMKGIKMPVDLKGEILHSIPRQSSRLIYFFLDGLTLIFFTLLFYAQTDEILTFLSRGFLSLLALSDIQILGFPLLAFLPLALGTGIIGLNIFKQQT